MKNLLTTLIAFGILAFGSVANAAVLTYFLTDSNVDALDVTGGDYYAAVIIRDDGVYDYGVDGGGEKSLSDTGDILVTVNVNTDMFTALGNFGLDKFSFNYDMTVLGSDPEVTLDASTIAITDINPDTWNVSLDGTKSTSVFGVFDIDLAGTGNARTDILSFLISGVDNDVADNYAVYFAGHIASFDSGLFDSEEKAIESAFFAGNGHGDRGLIPPVPIPAAAWLFGSGLIGLVGVARRKVTDNNV